MKPMCDHDDQDHDVEVHDPYLRHPRDRAIQADDPMMLEPVEIDGDPEIMIDCLIEEFARMGWDTPTIVRMFDDPFYEGPYRARQLYTAEAFAARVRRVLARCGTMRVRLVECAHDQGPEEKPVVLTLRGRSIA
jgi:hypothetical protein